MINYGYDENYIYKSLHYVFFHQLVKDTTSFDDFIKRFDFVEKRYVVYIGYSQDISCLFLLFQKMKLKDEDIELVDVKSVPIGIKTKKQKTILRFNSIKSLDYYSAYELAKNISSLIIDIHSFYLHRSNAYR